MRPITFLTAACAALVWAGSALAALPEDGFLVFKESRSGSVAEVRLHGSGQIVAHAKGHASEVDHTDKCGDPSFAFLGPRWQKFEPYHVNLASTPSHLDPAATLAALQRAHQVWELPFATPCSKPKGKTKYEAIYGGTTTSGASLVSELSGDGVNAVAFQSLEGTACDGAAACVVLEFRKRKVLEADIAFEQDLTRYGYEDYWTTDDTTWWDDVGGRWAVIDVATHEFGHFAGLGHVHDSPELTMFPYIGDGAQTLGFGDMLGIIARY